MLKKKKKKKGRDATCGVWTTSSACQLRAWVATHTCMYYVNLHIFSFPLPTLIRLNMWWWRDSLCLYQEMHSMCCVAVFNPDSCDAVSSTDLKGTIVWPDTVAGVIVYQQCPVKLPGYEQARATRQCLDVGSTSRMSVWQAPNTAACPFLSETTRKLQSLASVRDTVYWVNLTRSASLVTWHDS